MASHTGSDDYMETSRRIVHHTIDNGEWPAPVKDLAKSLALSLPSILRTGPHPNHISRLHIHLLTELSNSNIELGNESPSRVSVTDLFDTILTTVNTVRQLVEAYGHALMRRIPIWDRLIFPLGYALSPEYLTLPEVPFYLPRWLWSSDDGPIDGSSHDLMCYVVKKSFLASHMKSGEMDTSQTPPGISSPPEEEGEDADGHGDEGGEGDEGDEGDEDEEDEEENEDDDDDDDDDDDEDEDDDDDDVSMSFPASRCSYSPRKPNIFEQLGAVSLFPPTPPPPSDASSKASIDLPLDAHLLLGPRSGKRRCALLPIVCVADGENIVGLLASVLYQRRVFGIKEPAVGILNSRNGIFGQVVLGWLDPECDDGSSLPTVHIAYASRTTEHTPRNGIFDFSDTVSTFSFAQFILGLEPHFNNIKNAAFQPEITALQWRPDHIPNKWQSTEERVAQWARGIAGLDDSTNGDSSDLVPPSNSLAAKCPPSKLPMETGKQPPISKASANGSSSNLDVQPPIDQAE